MTHAEFQNLLLLADRMISSRVSRIAEYGRGYSQGIRFHFNNPRSTPTPDHHNISLISPAGTAARMFIRTLVGIVMAARG